MAAELRSRFPDSPTGFSIGAQIAHDLRRFDEAARLAAELRSRFPDSPAGFSIGGQVAHDLRQFEEAARLGAELRSRFSDNPTGYSIGAQVALQLKRYDEAMRLATELRSRFPNIAVGYSAGGAAAREARYLDEAAAIFSDAMLRFPTAAWPLMGKGLTASARGDVEEAERLASELRSRFPEQVKNSVTDPLSIGEVSTASISGVIGMAMCPGKKDTFRGMDRDLVRDVETIRDWGAEIVMTLIGPLEMELLKINDLGIVVEQHGMRWLHLPFAQGFPATESRWVVVGPKVRQVLRDGGRVLIHCRGGVDRTGMIAARLLVELGTDPDTAIRIVRRVRPGAIKAREQENYVSRTMVLNA